MTGITCRGLTVRYGEQRAVADVDLDVGPGTIHAVVGPSGCGKSSFLSALNRMTDLVPGARVEGRVLLGDENVLAPDTDLRRLRRRVGMVFQTPNPFALSVEENLTLGLRDHGIRSREARRAAAEGALRAVGLWDEVSDRLDSPALALSGGQQQRLCIARALVLEPEVLLLDEPCSALDPISSEVVEECVVSLRGRYTLVVVTHNLAQARRIADRTALFWKVDGAGRLVEDGCTRQIFDAPRHELTRAYVDGRSG